MKLIKPFFILVLVMALVLSIAATPKEEVDNYEVTDEYDQDATIESFDYAAETEQSSSLRGIDRFLTQKKLTCRLACNKYPRICRAKGSLGPNCCKKMCVNVLTDHLNCGICGKKCKYNQICCQGKCVNSSFNKGHCGRCNNGCNNGSFCTFGLCSYA